MMNIKEFEQKAPNWTQLQLSLFCEPYVPDEESQDDYDELPYE